MITGKQECLKSALKGKNANYYMPDERIFFENGADRKQFFERLKEANGVNSWRELAEKFNLFRTHFQYYQYGKLTFPPALFHRFLESFAESEKDFFLQRISVKPKSWGVSKGGKTTYSRYPNLFEKGRKKAHAVIREKHSFDFDIPLSNNLCEFVGALIGDGFTNKYLRCGITEFCGDKRLDKSYYEKIINPIAKELFKIEPHFRFRENAMWIRFYSNDLHALLTKRFGIPAGIKFDKVLIPEEILSSNSEFVASAVRGIFDTDGTVYFDKRKTYKEPYIRVALHMHNPPLIKQVHLILLSFGLEAKILSDARTVQINGKLAVSKFLEKVGFSNDKHVQRIRAVYPSLSSFTI